MPSAIRHITFDTAAPYEPYDLALFWSEILGYPVDPEDEPGADEVGLAVPEGQPTLLFVRVPESKTLKNRVHLDLDPDQLRDLEVERIKKIDGVQVVDDRRRPNGRGWVVFADPAGNEFCVEASAEERAVFEAQDAEKEAAEG